MSVLASLKYRLGCRCNPNKGTSYVVCCKVREEVLASFLYDLNRNINSLEKAIQTIETCGRLSEEDHKPREKGTIARLKRMKERMQRDRSDNHISNEEWLLYLIHWERAVALVLFDYLWEYKKLIVDEHNEYVIDDLNP